MGYTYYITQPQNRIELNLDTFSIPITPMDDQCENVSTQVCNPHTAPLQPPSSLVTRNVT